MDQTEPYHDPGRQRRPRRPKLPERQHPLEQQSSRRPTPPELACPVIAGFDGSTSARNALAYAAGMAKRLRRPLLVVYVVGSVIYCDPLSGMVFAVPRDTEALERWLVAELNQVTDPAGLSVHVRTRRGIPARELAAMAAELKADALVIGAPTHFWHHVAGSVPAWLARNACCPVITVP